MMSTPKQAVCYPLLAIFLLGVGAAQAADFPFVNDFNSVSFTHVASSPGPVRFTLDAANGALNFVEPGGSGTVTSTASEEINWSGPTNFVVSTRFTLNQSAGSANAASIGFGVLSSTADFAVAAEYYLADWSITPSYSGAGRVRFVSTGNSDFATTRGDSGGAASIVEGKTYELRLTGTYINGTLNMTLAVFDEQGVQLGTAATATDTSPLTGRFFGFRNRTAHATQIVNISYDNFRVEPGGAPSVNAGPDQTISLADGVANLKGIVSDDGIPNPPGAVQTLWSVDSQPPDGNATFQDATALETTVTVAAAGVYILRLTACDDGAPGACNSEEASDTMTLTVEDRASWDGGGAANDNWSSAENWFGDQLPDFISGTELLEFRGTVRPTPNNDIADAHIATLLFSPTATAFTLGGNGFTVEDLILNSSVHTQTLATGPLALGAGATIKAEAGALDIDADVLLPGPFDDVIVDGGQTTRIDGQISGELNSLFKQGGGVLVLSNNANSYAGRTLVNAGTIEVAGGNALGLADPDGYIDAAGDSEGVQGNTVQVSDGSPTDWFAVGSTADNRWGLRTDFGNEGSVFECSASTTVLEDCPPIQTTISGLTPGQSYPVYVHYWSRNTREWAVRAGLSSDSLTLFDRTGSVHGTETATAGVPTGFTAQNGTILELTGYLGMATATGEGEIVVYIDDVPSATNGELDRTWYDGVSVGQDHSTLVAGGAATSQLLFSGGVTSPEPIRLVGRSNGVSHIVSNGANTLTGPLSMSGPVYLESGAGGLTVAGPVSGSNGTLTLRGANGEVSGAISGAIAITKPDAGAWTLSGENTAAGNVIVGDNTTLAASTLKLVQPGSANNISAAPTINVAMGATLDTTGLAGGSLALAPGQTLVGAGTVNGGLTLGAGANLAVTDTVVPTLTLTNGLTLEDGGIIQLRLGQLSDLIRVTGGTVTGAGTGGICVGILNRIGTMVPNTTYTLIDWSGATLSGVEAEDFRIASPVMLGSFEVTPSALLFHYVGQDTTTRMMENFDECNRPLRSVAGQLANGRYGGNWLLAAHTTTDFMQVAAEPGNPGNHVLRVGPPSDFPAGIRAVSLVNTNDRIVDGEVGTMFLQIYVTSDEVLLTSIGIEDDQPTETGNLPCRVDIVGNGPGTGTATIFDGVSGVPVKTIDVGVWYNLWWLVDLGATEVCDIYLNTGQSSAFPGDLIINDQPVIRNLDPSQNLTGPAIRTNTSDTVAEGTMFVYVDNIYWDGSALNPTFMLQGNGGRFDFNDDEVIDDADLARFEACLTGPEVPGPAPTCDVADHLRADDDRDGDVDQDDFGELQRCYSGSALADPACL